MSDQNNTSFAHAFLPGLILGLIVGAVAGAFVPDMMTANSIKPPTHSGEVHPRDGDLGASAQDLLDEAEQAAQDALDETNLDEQAEDAVDDIQDAAEEMIDDAKNTLPESP
ncbi:MAG: hypothetical protein ACSHX5_10570 [Phycisphaerales bacterium]